MRIICLEEKEYELLCQMVLEGKLAHKKNLLQSKGRLDVENQIEEQMNKLIVSLLKEAVKEN